MRILGVVAVLVLLAGCGTVTPLEELERQALITGDWSAVEARERMNERRRMRSGNNSCPGGFVAYCEGYGGQMECTCMTSQSVQRSLALGYR